MEDHSEKNLGNWKMRRRFMWIITIFCMYCILHILYWGGDSRVNEAIIMWAFLCMGGTLGSYVFGAAWQDIHVIQSSRGKRRDE